MAELRGFERLLKPCQNAPENGNLCPVELEEAAETNTGKFWRWKWEEWAEGGEESEQIKVLNNKSNIKMAFCVFKRWIPRINPGSGCFGGVSVSTQDNKDTKGKIFPHHWIQGEIPASDTKNDDLPEFFHEGKTDPRKLRCFRSGWAVFPPPALKVTPKPKN